MMVPGGGVRTSIYMHIQTGLYVASFRLPELPRLIGADEVSNSHFPSQSITP